MGCRANRGLPGAVEEPGVADHEFRPGEDIRAEEVFIVARCSCGWEGGAYPASESGYDEARDEFTEHEAAPLRHRDRPESGPVPQEEA